MTLEITQDNFEKEVEQSLVPVLVDFWAPWCGPCRSQGPIVEDLAVEYEGRVKVVKVNVDNNSELARKFGVMSIPTLIIFKGGKNVWQTIGLNSRAILVKKFDEVLAG